jgi:hypothetical protein
MKVPYEDRFGTRVPEAAFPLPVGRVRPPAKLPEKLVSFLDFMEGYLRLTPEELATDNPPRRLPRLPRRLRRARRGRQRPLPKSSSEPSAPGPSEPRPGEPPRPPRPLRRHRHRHPPLRRGP